VLTPEQQLELALPRSSAPCKRFLLQHLSAGVTSSSTIRCAEGLGCAFSRQHDRHNYHVLHGQVGLHLLCTQHLCHTAAVP